MLVLIHCLHPVRLSNHSEVPGIPEMSTYLYLYSSIWYQSHGYNLGEPLHTHSTQTIISSLSKCSSIAWKTPIHSKESYTSPWQLYLPLYFNIAPYKLTLTGLHIAFSIMNLPFLPSFSSLLHAASLEHSLLCFSHKLPHPPRAAHPSCSSPSDSPALYPCSRYISAASLQTKKPIKEANEHLITKQPYMQNMSPAKELLLILR